MFSPIVQYQPGREFDYFVLEMYENMREHWELDNLLGPASQTPSGMLSFFRDFPLYVQFYNNRIVYAAWFVPFMGAQQLTVWFHPDFRQKREKAYFFLDLLQGMFNTGCPAIIGWLRDRDTKEATKAYIRMHEKWGYEYSGLMQYCFEGSDCHIVVLTKENFDNAPMNRLKKSWLQRKQTEG